MTRRGVSLIEIIIAMTIALIVSGVLFFSFFTNQRNAEKGIEILDFLRKATILVEYLKMDIRAALRAKDAIKANSAGTEITIKRAMGDKTGTVTYKYDAAGHLVTRKAPGEPIKNLGTDGNLGTVQEFAVKPVDKMPGFYRIDVKFETIAKMREGQPQTPEAENQPKRHAYEFHTLVNKRAPEDDEREPLWHYAYDPE